MVINNMIHSYESQPPTARSYRAIRALRARHSRPRDLGQLIEELETLQEQFAPYRANYVRMLRAANNPEVCTVSHVLTKSL